MSAHLSFSLGGLAWTMAGIPSVSLAASLDATALQKKKGFGYRHYFQPQIYYLFSVILSKAFNIEDFQFLNH